MFWRRLLVGPEGKQRQTHRGAFGKSFNSSSHYSQTVPSNRLAKEAVCRNGFAELVKKHEAQEARHFVTHTVDAAGRTSGYRLSCGLDVAAQPILAPYRNTTRTARSRWTTRTPTISVTTSSDNHTEYENHRTIGAWELESYCLFSSLRHLYPRSL